MTLNLPSEGRIGKRSLFVIQTLASKPFTNAAGPQEEQI